MVAVAPSFWAGALMSLLIVAVVGACVYIVNVSLAGKQERPPPAPVHQIAPPPPPVLLPATVQQPPRNLDVIMVLDTANDYIGATSAPVTFKQVGFVELADGYMTPLYGKQSATRRHRWYYYALYDGIKMPVTVNKRDCMEDVGCDELMDGDTVTLGKRSGTVSMYRTGTRYE